MSSNNKKDSQLPMRSEDYIGDRRQGRLLGIRKVLEKYDVSKSTLYNRIKAGQFPGPKTDVGRALWLESEVNDALLAIVRRSSANKKEGE